MSDAWMARLRNPNPWHVPSPLPSPITTPRLIVRLFAVGDGPGLYEAINDGRDKLLPWLLWALTDHQRVDDSTFFVEQSRRDAARPSCTDYRFGIFDRESGAVLGGAGLVRIDVQNRCAEIGYWVRGSAHGQGIATEATAHLTTAALTPKEEGGWDFRRVILHADSDNLASRRVPEKLGYRLELRARRERYTDYGRGGHPFGDLHGYAVLHDEWDRVRHRAKPGIGWDDLGEPSVGT